MNTDEIKITKARVHNLKDVDITIPKNTLTVVTGPSGSGKSSLAFDTIYVEGEDAISNLFLLMLDNF